MITLDGDTKLITLTEDYSFTDKQIYDAAIDWSVLESSMKYLLPFDFVAPNYRLLNGWKLNASGYAAGKLITVVGSIKAVSGDRVEGGTDVEWDIGTAINTIMIPVGSGLSAEEHNALLEVKDKTANIQDSKDVASKDDVIAFS